MQANRLQERFARRRKEEKERRKTKGRNVGEMRGRKCEVTQSTTTNPLESGGGGKESSVEGMGRRGDRR